MADEYLTFHVGAEQCAMSIGRVREIIQLGPVTRVPNGPRELRGVINLRGNVVPVFDLAVLLGLPALETSRRACILIIEPVSGGDERLGLTGVLVDAVSDVVLIPGAQLAAPPAFGSALRPEGVAAFASVDGRLMPVLHVDRLLVPGGTRTGVVP